MEQKITENSLMAIETTDKSRDLFDYYIRRGDTYRIYSNWVPLDLTREQFAWYLAQHGLKLNEAGEPVCPITGLKKSHVSLKFP